VIIEKSNIIELEQKLIREIRVDPNIQGNILFSFHDEEFLFVVTRTKTFTLLLEDWSEVSFSFSNIGWQPLGSDEKYIYLIPRNPKTKALLLVWNKEEDDEEVVLEDFAQNLPKKNINSPHRVRLIYTDANNLYCGLDSGNVCILNKNNWSVIHSITTNSLLDYSQIVGVVASKNHIIIGVQGQEFQGKNKRYLLNVYDIQNFALISSENIYDKIHKLHCYNNRVIIHFSTGTVALFSTETLKISSKFPKKKGFNAINIDENYLYGAIEDKIKVINLKSLSYFASFTIKSNRQIKYIFSLEKTLLAIAPRGIIHIFEPISISVSNKFRSEIIKFHNILIRTDFLQLDQLRTLIGFEDNIDLLNWLYILPIELPFKISGETIRFNREKMKKDGAEEDVESMISDYESWYSKENEQKLANIVRKTEYLETQTLAKLLGFTDPVKLLNWIYILPANMPIVVKGEQIHFGFENYEDKDIQNSIDVLLEQYSKFERNQIAKKND